MKNKESCYAVASLLGLEEVLRRLDSVEAAIKSLQEQVLSLQAQVKALWEQVAVNKRAVRRTASTLDASA
jgi:cell division septum initiation protein DivIVA